MIKLLAVDPGKTSGVAVYDLETDVVIACAQFATPPYETFVEYVRGSRVVVCESFAGNTANPDHQATVRLIGFLEGLCEINQIPFVLQVPSARYPFRETALRLLDKKNYVHAGDALAHALCYQKLYNTTGIHHYGRS